MEDIGKNEVLVLLRAKEIFKEKIFETTGLASSDTTLAAPSILSTISSQVIQHEDCPVLLTIPPDSTLASSSISLQTFQDENQSTNSDFRLSIIPAASTSNFNSKYDYIQEPEYSFPLDNNVISNVEILQPINSDQFKNFKIPWGKLPELILQRCKGNQKLHPSEYSTFVHLIVMEMRQINKYIRKITFENVAKEIVAKLSTDLSTKRF